MCDSLKLSVCKILSQFHIHFFFLFKVLEYVKKGATKSLESNILMI